MNIVVLTGAGISAESGLATFRDAGGVWQRVRLEEVATPEAFRRDPDKVHAFYNARRAQLRDPGVRPNAAHEALVRLEREHKGGFLLVTQNVDGLHARAGSRRLIEMHGALRRLRCLRCAVVQEGWEGDCTTSTPCPNCREPGGLRPDIVWFGEMPVRMGEIEAALAECDLFVSVGTSGQVYPAAGFVEAASDRGARTLELNLEPSAGSALFEEARHGPATRLVPAWVEEALEG